MPENLPTPDESIKRLWKENLVADSAKQISMDLLK